MSVWRHAILGLTDAHVRSCVVVAASPAFSCAQVVASAEEVVFVLTMLPLVLMVGLGLFRMDWGLVTTPPAMGTVDWKLFIQIMFWTSTYWQKVGAIHESLWIHVPSLAPQ